MKYKEIFKKWWFWLAIVFYSLIVIVEDTQEYGSLFFAEYVGIFIGSSLSILGFFTILFLIIKLGMKIKKGITRQKIN